MRATLDLPDELLKRAKVEAVERGTSLRDLVGAALERELNLPSEPKPMRKRARFPIFDSKAPGALRLINAEIVKLDGDEDHRRHGRALKKILLDTTVPTGIVVPARVNLKLRRV